MKSVHQFTGPELKQLIVDWMASKGIRISTSDDFQIDKNANVTITVIVPVDVAPSSVTDQPIPASSVVTLPVDVTHPQTEYSELFDSCVINRDRLVETQSIVDRIIAKKDLYHQVEQNTGVPWYVVAAIHSLESDLDFSTHLHNGDPLTGQTVHEPKGRPLGNPPFTWEQSAEDALRYDRLSDNRDWSISGALAELEKYNGLGYRKLANPIPTPYLWAGSNHYSKGKFTSDHHFDPDSISNQVGAAVLIKLMQQTGNISVS